MNGDLMNMNGNAKMTDFKAVHFSGNEYFIFVWNKFKVTSN